MLPLLPISEYVPEVVGCFDRLRSEKLRQNEAHGLVLRANIFLDAYFKYRAHASPVAGQAELFKADDGRIAGALFDFQAHLPQWTGYSKMTWALFVRTFRKTLAKLSPDSYASQKQSLD